MLFTAPLFRPIASSALPFSFLIFLSLVMIIALSSLMFWLLVRRATSHRQWVALSDWAQDEGFRFTRRKDAVAPAPFDALALERRPMVRLQLARRDGTVLLQLQRSRSVDSNSTRVDPTWNLLIRPLSTEWIPTGLRPAPDGAAATFSAARSSLRAGDESLQSLAELFDLPSYPLMRGSGRLLVHGSDSVAARKLSTSVISALLPPDAGLLLYGSNLVLDFSRRPFDVLEFNRVLALADQVASRLPAQVTSGK